MNKTLAATAIVALLGAGGVADAADLYGGSKDGAIPAAAYPSWTGYYIGVHIGGAWAAADFTDVNGATPVAFNGDATGVFGGGQIGFAYQLGNLVIGPEVDIGDIGLSRSTTETGGVGAVSAVSSGFYFDITGRLGYAFGPAALLYAKGGYAYYGGSLSVTDSSGSYSHNDLTGYTVGAGLEYKITPAWSVKAEYQYFDFNTSSQLATPIGNVFDNNFEVQTFKVGANYHFCSPYQPLK